MKKSKLIILILFILLTTTGCKQDNMEGIDIVVTNYPNEFIVSKLYGEHSNIESIYPDGVDIEKYKITKRQKNKYSNKDLFIYNGLIEKERNLAVNLLELNNDLKIIDSSYVLEEEYSEEELWLAPSSLLMMTKNIQIGLDEYITSTYLKKEIDEAYEELKVELSELDADYRIAVENTKNKTILVNDNSLKYLEKFGITVLSLDNEATPKEIADIESQIQNKTISYIYIFREEEQSTNTKNIIQKYTDIKTIELHKLDNLSDKEREEKEDYFSIMNNNLELIKQELYQ